MDYNREITRHREELVSLRRDFHMNPELGFREHRTSGIIADYLQDLGMDVKSGLAKTGVVGLLEGEKPGSTLMLRSDMDALPINEENDFPYRSQADGVMHACGHDAHMAMLLVAAKILSNHIDEFKGKIKFVFQPNEEDAGAELMVEDGVLKNPDVDAAMGLHIWTPIETGKIAIVEGPVMASSWYFKLLIQGRGGHGGAPHTAIDPIICAANLIQTVQSIQTRETDALKPTVITFGKVYAGTYNIVIPEKATLEGSIRCLHFDDRDIRKRFREVVESVCAAHRCESELEYKCGNGLLSNNPSMTTLVKGVADELVGTDNIIGEEIRMMIGEDFAEFALRVPSSFYFLGTGNQDKGTAYPHHHPKFNIDEDSLPLGVEMHIKTALAYLNQL